MQISWTPRSSLTHQPETETRTEWGREEGSEGGRGGGSQRYRHRNRLTHSRWLVHNEKAEKRRMLLYEDRLSSRRNLSPSVEQQRLYKPLEAALFLSILQPFFWFNSYSACSAISALLRGSFICFASCLSICSALDCFVDYNTKGSELQAHRLKAQFEGNLQCVSVSLQFLARDRWGDGEKNESYI